MDPEYVKRHDDWNRYAKILDSNHSSVFFHEREIWWCAIGVNIGSEQDGKNENFERPILVLRKIKRDLILVAPFTTKISDAEYRITSSISGATSQLLFSQMRTISSKRLLRKIGRLRTATFQEAVIEVAKLVLSRKDKIETPPNRAAERGISEP